MRDRRTIFFTGVALIVTGILVAVISVQGSARIIQFVPIVAGVAFCVAGAVSRIPGMYLPGALLTGAGVGIVVALGTGTTDEPILIGIFLLSIGASLATVPFLSRFTGWELVRWPLVSASLLTGAGLLLILANPEGSAGRFAVRAWPAATALAVAWIVLVFSHGRSSGRSSGRSRADHRRSASAEDATPRNRQ